MRNTSEQAKECALSVHERYLTWTPLIAYLTGVIYFLSQSSFSLFHFPLDDSWIHAVYARSFAFGHGFQYVPGQQEAGSTSPLWAIVSSPCHWLSVLNVNSVVVAVKVLSILLGFCTVWLAFRIFLKATGSFLTACVTSTFLAVDGRFLFSSLSGMETNLLLALWLGSTFTFLSRGWSISVFLSGLAAVCRPEAAMLLFLWPVALMFVEKEKPASGWVWYWLLSFAPAMVWVLFCHSVNDRWLPNTFYMKASTEFILGKDQIKTLWQILSQHGVSSSLAFIPGIAIFLGFVFGRLTFRMKVLFFYFFLLPILYAIGIAGSRSLSSEGFYWTRWLDPPSILFSTAAAFGLVMPAGLLRSFRSRVNTCETGGRLGRHRWVVGLFGIAGLVLLVSSFPSVWRSLTERRQHLATDCRAIYMINERTAQWIHDHTPPDAVVAVNDAGAIRYIAGRRTIDLMGLNNSDLVSAKKTVRQLLQEADWVAIFPSWFPSFEGLAGFQKRKSFSIPMLEYTICPCPGQNEKVIYEKVSR